MPAKVLSAAIAGLDAQIIEVEVDLHSGLHSFRIVGLPDKAVGESKERVSSALKNSGAKPAHRYNKRITVNLAPADIKKEGSLYDLPIAVGFLLASEQLRFSPDGKLFVGELSLDGKLRPINGALSIALLAKEKGIRTLFLPRANAEEAAVVKDIDVFGVDNLSHLMDHLEGRTSFEPYQFRETQGKISRLVSSLDMAHIKGQSHAKRALEIAASGAHNILMSGPPGTGKTLLAKTLPTIMPEMTREEALEVTKIYSVSGLLPRNNQGLLSERPFRSPHHTSSEAALIGGGSGLRPGEISLAHRGVLFLDEFPEFHRDLIESLRQPLEEGFVTISRTHGVTTYPARFMLVAAHNPCPCGWSGDPVKECTCTPNQVSRYQKKMSGPLLDRIDISLELPRVPYEELLSDSASGEKSETMKKRVEDARSIQNGRFRGELIHTNAEMTIPLIKKYCRIDLASQTILANALRKLHLSARSYHKILKVARTIADLNASSPIQAHHLAEAIQYRAVGGIYVV